MPKLQPEAEQEAARVLVVEDELFVRVAIAEDLRRAGFVVVEAGSAEEALSCLKAGVGFDLLFSDIQMPGSLDGADLARRLREQQPDLPVILTSGQAAPPADLGDVLFVAKPYDHRAVADVMLEALNLKRRRFE